MSEKIFKKNDEITLTITDISDDGSGIGRSNGFIFFIRNALPGDEIRAGVMKIQKNYGFARILEIVKPSPGRCSALCSVSEKCGGCTLQNYRYEEQLKYKYNKVKNDLIRIGGISEEETDKILLPIVGMDDPYRYRNKAQYPVRMGRDGKPHAGFFAGHTHSVIEADDCRIEPEKNTKILNAVTGWMNKNHVKAYNDESGEGLVRHVLIRHGFISGECQVNLIINGNKIPDEAGLVGALKDVMGDSLKSVTLCPNKRRDNVILGDSYRAIYGEGYITDTLVGITFKISPLSFYQVNPVQTAKLYGLARDYACLDGEEEVLDLYCGIGTISLMMAKNAGHVTGVEIVDRAIKDAKENAKINAIGNAEFITGAAEDVIQTMLPGKGNRRTPDVVVVDPPRKGCARSCIDAILTLAPSRVVYVSCDPATLARDIRIFREGGYELVKATPVDMFPHTAHVETVVQLSKGNINKGSSERSDAVKAGDFGVISGYSKGNKAPETTNVKIDFSLENLDLSELRGKATYEQIKDYVREQTEVRVSALYISQVKRKCGLEVGESYNKPKSEDSKQPQCTPEKEEAIMQALRHYGVI